MISILKLISIFVINLEIESGLKFSAYYLHHRSIGTSDESLDAGDHNEDEEAVNNITSAMSDYQSEFKQESELKYEPDDQTMTQFEGEHLQLNK